MVAAGKAMQVRSCSTVMHGFPVVKQSLDCKFKGEERGLSRSGLGFDFDFDLEDMAIASFPLWEISILAPTEDPTPGRQCR